MPQICCKFKFVLPSTCLHHCQQICQLSCPAHCCACQYVSIMEHSQSIQESCPAICSFKCLPSCPSFCSKVSPQMPSSCPSSCSVSCILPCQQHCCQERYPPNLSTQSPAICPLQSYSHVPGALLSCLIRTIVIFNNVNANRKCSAKLFATAKLCDTFTSPSSCSSYCSHSWLQYCCMGRQKSPYLFKPCNKHHRLQGLLRFKKPIISRKLYIIS